MRILWELTTSFLEDHPLVPLNDFSQRGLVEIGILRDASRAFDIVELVLECRFWSNG